MKYAMISQPMVGKTDEEIVETRKRATEVLELQGYSVVDTWFQDEWYSDENLKKNGIVQIPLYFLARSLEFMSKCEAVYFCSGWATTRGCQIEHEAAKRYGVKIIYENPFPNA